MNGPVIFLTKKTLSKPRLRGNNLVTRYGLPEGYFVIPNKTEYINDETWAEVVRVVAPGIRKMKARNVDYVIPIL